MNAISFMIINIKQSYLISSISVAINNVLISPKGSKGQTGNKCVVYSYEGKTCEPEGEEMYENYIVLPTQSYAPETWVWNVARQSQIHAVEMSNIRGACGVSRWNRKSNEMLMQVLVCV